MKKNCEGQYLSRPVGRFKILWVFGFFKVPVHRGIFLRKSFSDGRKDARWYYTPLITPQMSMNPPCVSSKPKSSVVGAKQQKKKTDSMQKYLLFVVAAGCLYANNNLLPFPEESCCTSVLVKLLQTKVRNSLRPGLTDYCTDLFIPRVRDIPRDIL